MCRQRLQRFVSDMADAHWPKARGLHIGNNDTSKGNNNIFNNNSNSNNNNNKHKHNKTICKHSNNKNDKNSNTISKTIIIIIIIIIIIVATTTDRLARLCYNSRQGSSCDAGHAAAQSQGAINRR